MAKARKKASKKASKKKSKKTRTPAQKRATAALVKRNKAKKTGKKTTKKRASTKRAAGAVTKKRKASKKTATGAVRKARRKRPAAWTKIQVAHHAREDAGTVYGPLPRKAARTARKYVKRGLMTHADLVQSYHKSVRPKRVTKKRVAKKAVARPVAKKHKTSQRVVTANDVLKNVTRKSSKLAVWMCANPNGRRTGCGGGKRGGHVVGVLR
jgi:hypothetical protein